MLCQFPYFLHDFKLFFSYLILYSVGRFLIEGMRTDSLMLFDILRVSQLVSIALILIAFTLIIYRRKSLKAEKSEELK
ncbi:prolipoprotein diacylglyceryl transferase family protein [Metabacillus herbersteinensis]|uniref:Prolipoprotein diacylglyceryl transferase family protein n=1 Tax=Metabacillus herbersteinensis TaxID=283816 RepID=A0ABV6GM93_9BACI